jgi:hypothetical protein
MPEPSPPGLPLRLATRFALLAFGLYHLPQLLNCYPSLGGGGFLPDGIAQVWGHVFTRPGLWIARTVFHLTGPMPDAANGDNGDTCEHYCRILAGVVIAAVAAIAWTIADRRKPRAPWVPEALRVLLRYAVVLGLMSYAVAKLLPMQYRPLGPPAYEQRVGELTPYYLLWYLMRSSRPYALFGGLAETAAVILLCFRRTTTLGALVCLAVMVDVALLNFCYGVPVKLYSTMIALSAAVLLLYDAPRLAGVLLFHRAVPAAPPAPPFRSRRLNQARWAVKLVLVGGAALSSALPMRAYLASITPTTLDGTWEVLASGRGGEAAPAADPLRWRRVAIGPRGKRTGVLLRQDDGRLVECWGKVDAEARTVTVECPSLKKKGTLGFEREGEALRLRGTFGEEAVEVTAKRRADEELPLVSTRFSWAYDG